jgi:hypothetical protein
MLRVEMHDSANSLVLRIQGRFTGEGAEDVRELVTRCHIEMSLVVDLTDLTFIDSVGENVLLFLKRFGAEFTSETAYSLDVCERLGLPIACRHISHTRFSQRSVGHECEATTDS